MKKPIAPLQGESIPLLPLLLVLFIGSGCSALIYEIVWSQLLELVIGASAISLAVLAGFYLLRVYDMAVATYVAASINVAVALGAFLMAKWSPYLPVESDSKEFTSPAPDSWPVYVAIALSGMAALGAEVVWTRLLS